MTERDRAGGAQAFQERQLDAWRIAGAPSTKEIESLSNEIGSRPGQKGSAFQALPVSTVHDNLFRPGKTRISKWSFTKSLRDVLAEFMVRQGNDPSVLGTENDWWKWHEAARRGELAPAKPGGAAGPEAEEQPGPHQDEWWSKYQAVIPVWARRHLTLEPLASRLMLYESRFVPDLLQTPGYARAAYLLLHPDAAPDEVEAHVELLMLRQRRIAGRTSLWVLLEPRALSFRVGSEQIMREQYESLADSYKRDDVSVQVMSRPAEEHGLETDPFVIMRFRYHDDPDVTYVAYQHGLPELWNGRYADSPAQRADFVVRLSVLGGQALSRIESRKLIVRMARN